MAESLRLVGVHLHEAGPGVVVDGDVGELPAGAFDRVAPVAGHAVARTHDAAELLGVDVQHLAGRRVLVAHDRAHRIERLQARQAQPSQQAADGRDAAAHELGDAAHRHAQPAQLLDPALRAPRRRCCACASGASCDRQALDAALLEAPEPLPGRAQADAGGLGRRRQPNHSNSLDQQLAPFNGQSAARRHISSARARREPARRADREHGERLVGEPLRAPARRQRPSAARRATRRSAGTCPSGCRSSAWRRGRDGSAPPRPDRRAAAHEPARLVGADRDQRHVEAAARPPWRAAKCARMSAKSFE